MEEFECNWTCADCETKNSRPLTKYEAAFFPSLGLENKCINCGSTKSKSSGWNQPDMDDELMMNWLENESLYIIEQDEDLMLMNISTQRLKNYINIAPPNRKALLFEALLVKLHDEEFSSKHERQETIDYLSSMQEQWENGHAWDYIKKGVEKKIRRNRNFVWKLFGA